MRSPAFPSGSLHGTLQSRFLPFFLAFIVIAFPNFLFIDIRPLVLPFPRISQPPIRSPTLFILLCSFFQLFLFLLTLSPLVNDFRLRSLSLSLSLSALVRGLSSDGLRPAVPAEFSDVCGFPGHSRPSCGLRTHSGGRSKWDLSGEGPGPLCVYHSMSLGGQ